MTAVFLPPRERLVDPATGMITPLWYRLFVTIFNSTGGTTGGTTVPEDLVLSPPVQSYDAYLTTVSQLSDGLSLSPPSYPAAPQIAPSTSDDVTPPPQPLFVALDDVLPLLGGMRDEIALLRRTIDDLRQGSISL